MVTPHTDTVVEKAVAFVKDIFGVHTKSAIDAEEKRKYCDTAPEVAAENAMSLDPDAYIVNPAGQVTPGTYATPMGESETERLIRLEKEANRREMSAMEYSVEQERRESGV